MSVRVLEPGVSGHIRSGHSLDSVTQCVLELVRNGVDANSSCLLVKVDTSSWRIQVLDDGAGISREDLSLVGERYATSKCPDLHSFGFRGEALASIVQVAQTVELTSRHRLSQLTYCKRFQDGHSVGIVSSVASLGQAGTRVTVHNLFYNLPVRRRHMAPSIEMEKLRSALCKALLVLPLVSLSLHDAQAGQRLLQVPRSGSMLTRFYQLFGTKTAGVQHTSVDDNGVKISALLSVEALRGSNLQLIFLSRRPVESQSLHMLVCRLLDPITSQDKTRDSQTRFTRGNWHPFYVIAVDSDMESDNCLNAANTHIHLEQEQKVINALTSLIHSFLSDNHFTPHRSPPSPVMLPSSSHRQREASLTPTTSSTPKFQPVSKLPSTLKAVVNPTTRQALYLHPVSGSTHAVDSSKLNPPVHHMLSTVQHVPSIRVQSTPTPLQNDTCLLTEWKNPTFSAGDGAVLAMETTRSYKSLIPHKFSKYSLKKIEVLGQVDNKFIACLLQTSSSSHLLVAIDQHAAHERVRLEALLQGLYDEGGQDVRVSAVSPPLPLYLTASQERMARCFSDKLAAIGVKLQWMDGKVFVATLPAILTEKVAGETPTMASLVQKMVQSHLEMLERTGGGVAGLPSSLADVLHSWACHGAIRFGDRLSLSDCQQLVQSLTFCSLPFQCAHGRPSLAPLVDLCLVAQRAPGLKTPFPELKRLTALINH